MSFKCDACNIGQKSGTKPTFVMPVMRPKNYSGSFINAEDEVVAYNTSGWEPEVELKICPTCAGLEPKPEVDQRKGDFAAIGNSKSPSVIHARTCKKLLSECVKCQRIVEMYAGLSLPNLNLALSEPLAKEVGVTIGSSMMSNIEMRTKHNSNRAFRDLEEVLTYLPNLKRLGIEHKPFQQA